MRCRAKSSLPGRARRQQNSACRTTTSLVPAVGTIPDQLEAIVDDLEAIIASQPLDHVGVMRADDIADHATLQAAHMVVVVGATVVARRAAAQRQLGRDSDRADDTPGVKASVARHARRRL